MTPPTTWVRAQGAARPKKVRIVLIYDTHAPENEVLEELQQQIAYGEGNKTFLECLRIGAATMLDRTAVPPSATNPAPAPGSRAAAVKTIAAGGKQPFSPAAAAHFQGE